jgi:hypothetical protein
LSLLTRRTNQAKKTSASSLRLSRTVPPHPRMLEKFNFSSRSWQKMPRMNRQLTSPPWVSSGKHLPFLTLAPAETMSSRRSRLSKISKTKSKCFKRVSSCSRLNFLMKTRYDFHPCLFIITMKDSDEAGAMDLYHHQSLQQRPHN